MFNSALRWLQSFQWPTFKIPGSTTAFLFGFGSLATALTAFWTYYSKFHIFFTNYLQIKQAGSDAAAIVTTGVNYFSALISEALSKASISSSPSDSTFVRRPFVESELNAIVSEENPEVYHIVYGPRGAGKSELVSHSVVGLPAVKLFKITSARSREELVKSFMYQLTGLESNLTSATIDEALRNFIREKKVFPTFIFDVERGSDVNPDTFNTLRAFAKELVKKARCILVLSEATAVLEFRGDPDRENYIYVDEMSELEANELLDKRGAPFNVTERRYIYDNLGTRAGMLVAMVGEYKRTRKSVKECVDRKVKDAATHLKNFPLKPILLALKERPDGVPLDQFENQMCGNVNLFDVREVGTVMRARAESNPLVYRVELGEYQLLSSAFKTALKSYHPAA